MKKIKMLTLLLLIFSVLPTSAQEKARYKCAYQFDFLRDTIKMEYFRQETYIVQIGDNVTKGFTYQKTYIDSLRTHAYDLYNTLFKEAAVKAREIRVKTGSLEGYGNSIINLGSFLSDIYKDYKKNEIRVLDYIFTQSFVYKDELKPQEWEILEDTTTILGYHCQKAICHYRGRDYEAWFTPEIPISEGPWKFYGLPGLITKLHDTKKHYSFELKGFQEVNEVINTKIDRKAQKIERKEFYRTDSGDKGIKIMETEMSSVGLNSSGNRPQRHCDYIERDYRE